MTSLLVRFTSRLSGWFGPDDAHAEAVAIQPSFAEWIVMVGGAL